MNQPIVPRQGGDHRHRAEGFTIMGLILIMTLLTVFLAFSAQLFAAASAATRDSARAVQRVASAQAALRMLREDAWFARDITLQGVTQVKLIAADGRVSLWTLEPTGDLTRQRLDAPDAPGDHPTQRWPLGDGAMRFEIEGPTLLLRIEAGAGRVQVVPFTSEPLRLAALEKTMSQGAAAKP